MRLIIHRIVARAFAALALGFAGMMAAQAAETRPAQLIVHLLDYVSADYPGFVKDGRVLDEMEYREQLEFSGQVIELLGKLPDNPAKPELSAQARGLRARIEAKAAGEEVTRLANGLRRRIIDAYQLVVAPRRAPDLRAAAVLYAKSCAGCHGVQGRGDGPAAKDMDPAPGDFHDAARRSNRSVYGLYNTITLGIKGTPMPAFGMLTEEERWALAFYVAGFGVDPVLAARGETQWKTDPAVRAAFPGLREVATTTPAEAREKYGEGGAAALGWLIRKPAALEASRGSPVATSKHLLAQALAAYRRGERDQAQRLAVSAYLDGFELAEASLEAVDRSLRVAIENEMMRLRSLMRSGAAATEIEAQVATLSESLVRAEKRLGGTGLSPTTAAVSAFLIVFREGLEALLVVAAIIAFLVKAGRREALPWIHAGWIGALALGLATWFAAAALIEVSGATRELTEGLTTLIAAAILVYVGCWLHTKAYARVWKAFIEQHLKSALRHGTLWALAGVSFLAVYREAFETVLFYQALWQQAGEGAAGSVLVGFSSGVATLGTVAWTILRYSVRLPIGIFFTASSILLAILAVVFTGHGVKALQEAGVIATSPIDAAGLRALGFYPSMETALAQAAVLLLIVGAFAWTRAVNRRSVTTS